MSSLEVVKLSRESSKTTDVTLQYPNYCVYIIQMYSLLYHILPLCSDCKNDLQWNPSLKPCDKERGYANSRSNRKVRTPIAYPRTAKTQPEVSGALGRFGTDRQYVMGGFLVLIYQVIRPDEFYRMSSYRVSSFRVSTALVSMLPQ